MQFIKSNINIDFTGKKFIAAGISMALILLSLISLIAHKGPKYGIDFAGGTQIRVKFENPTTIEAVKTGLRNMQMTKSPVQQFGDSKENAYSIMAENSQTTTDKFSTRLTEALSQASGGNVTIQSFEMVGPQVGKDLREKALLAMFYALLFITIYISGRFELKWMLSAVVAIALMTAIYVSQLLNVSIPFLIGAALIITLVLFWFLELKYAMGAIVALIHDVAITVGLFSLFGKEFTLPIIAALLTIIGYSLNDTIIIFDRIRENLRKHHKMTLSSIINRSINETLSRTLLTSLTTLAVVVALFFLGGGIIHDFAFALIAGVLIGTYSSIFVASPILLAWQSKKRR